MFLSVCANMSYKLFPNCTALHYILFIIVIVDPRINIDKIAKHTFELNSQASDGIIYLTEIFRVIIWLINSTYTCPMMGESWDSGMLNNDPSSQKLVQHFCFVFSIIVGALNILGIVSSGLRQPQWWHHTRYASTPFLDELRLLIYDMILTAWLHGVVLSYLKLRVLII
jgi:hypothetical protein